MKAVSMRAPESAERGVCVDTYDRHGGLYSVSLAAQMMRLGGITSGQRALDVGCGPGALTSALAGALGPQNVAAVDPHEPFVQACSEHVPGVELRVGAAERLPFADGHFDVVLTQLALDVLEDPRRAVEEMRRVVRPGGVIAACVWDYPGEMTILRIFWDAATELDPRATTALHEARRMRFCRRGALGQLWHSTAIERVEERELLASAHYADFDTLWAPFEAGVAPGSTYYKALDTRAKTALRDECWRRLGSPTGSFYLTARAWAVRGRNGADKR